MDKGLLSYYQSAKELGLAFANHPDIESLQIILGQKNYFISSGMSPFNNSGNISLGRNRTAQNDVLKKSGIPVIKGCYIDYYDFHEGFLDSHISHLVFPLIVRSNVNNAGDDIFKVNVTNISELKEHLSLCFKKHYAVFVQETLQKHKLYQALFLKNKPLNFIELKQVPTILNDANQAIAGPLLKNIPKENIDYLTGISKRLGLDLVSIDFYCKNLEVSFDKTKWFFWDANSNPKVYIHEEFEKNKNSLTKLILNQLIKRHPIAYFKYFLKNYGHHE